MMFVCSTFVPLSSLVICINIIAQDRWSAAIGLHWILCFHELMYEYPVSYSCQCERTLSIVGGSSVAVSIVIE